MYVNVSLVFIVASFCSFAVEVSSFVIIKVFISNYTTEYSTNVKTISETILNLRRLVEGRVKNVFSREIVKLLFFVNPWVDLLPFPPRPTSQFKKN